MSIFNVIKEKFLESSLRIGKIRAREQLLTMSDRQLEDAGFSKQLLLQGVSAWPWRSEQTEAGSALKLAVVPAVGQVAQGSVSFDDRTIDRAIKELNSYSDRELAELGVTRNSIDEIVRYGRPTIEGVFENNRTAA